MKFENLNILLAGVGGQGIIKASEVIAESLLSLGYDLKRSEIHGLSQRGGSVSSNLRAGKKVYSPTIMAGDVDYLISFEKLETMRYAHMMKKNGTILMNNQEIKPASCITGGEKYPTNIEETLKKYGNLKSVNGYDMAVKLGNVKCLNICLVGAFSKLVDIPEDVFIEGIKAKIKPKFVELNIEAFKMGRESIK